MGSGAKMNEMTAITIVGLLGALIGLLIGFKMGFKRGDTAGSRRGFARGLCVSRDMVQRIQNAA